MICSNQKRMADLFADGFVGSRNEAADRLGIKRSLGYKYIIALHGKRAIVRVGRDRQSDIWAASSQPVQAPVVIPNIGIVTHALAARPVLHLWACGELRA